MMLCKKLHVELSNARLQRPADPDSIAFPYVLIHLLLFVLLHTCRIKVETLFHPERCGMLRSGLSQAAHHASQR